MSPELNFNFFNILIVAGTIQGILFSIIVLSLKKYRLSPNRFLAQVVLYLSLNNLYYWFIDTNISNNFKYYEFLYIPWNLLVLPMYYFFVTNYLTLRLSKKEKIYFLLPFIISLIIHFLLLIHKLFFENYFTIPLKIKYTFYYTEEYLSIIYTIFLIYKTYTLVKSNEEKNKNYVISEVHINTKWLKRLLYFGIIICAFWLLIIFLNQYNIRSLFQNNGKYLLWLSISFLIYWLGYMGVYHSGIFNEQQQIRSNISKNNNQVKKGKLNYSKFEEIDIIIKEDKTYLNPNLSLELLPNEFNLSSGYLSQLFNQFTNGNFSSYINKLRIEMSMKMLTDDDFSNYTIAAIGLESGFNSKSAFYNAFKKITGITPVEFKKKMS